MARFLLHRHLAKKISKNKARKCSQNFAKNCSKLFFQILTLFNTKNLHTRKNVLNFASTKTKKALKKS